MSITKEEIFKEKMDSLAISIVNKSGASGKKSLDELKMLVDDELVKQIEEFDGTVEVVEITITFTINSTEYQAESDMTWAEWCNSKYNTGSYTVYNNKIFTSSLSAVVIPPNDYVYSNDVIIEDYPYSIYTGGSN
jgi:hypothetical protein